MLALSALWTAAVGLAAALPAAPAADAAGEEACPNLEQSPAQIDEQSLLQIDLGTKSRGASPWRSWTGPYRQSLANMGDLQYTGNVTMGTQELQAVLDTGSFEILVFSRDCWTCGRAGLRGYSHHTSDTYDAGRLVKTHVYGSGSARTFDGVELCRVGPYAVQRQDFWEAMSASMPVLNSASFQAIVGLGPPGEPQRMAKRLRDSARRILEAPRATDGSRRMASQDLEIAQLILAKNDSLLHNLNLRYISACFEWASGADGYLIWNDTPPETQSVPFTSVGVISPIHWSAQMTWSRFEGPEGVIDLGCGTGCEAVLDTGTSLIAVPSSVYREALNRLNQLDADCNNMAQMPNLVFGLGEHTFSLPPQSYIGVIRGGAPEDPSGWLHTSETRARACELLLMDSGGGSSDLGPLWILGMPFFRYYYTTFDLGSNPFAESERKIWMAPAAAGCVPADEQSHSFKVSHARQQPLWTINGSSIRIPRMRHRRTSSKVKLAEDRVGAEDEEFEEVVNWRQHSSK